MLDRAVNLAKGSAEPNKNRVGKITMKQVEEIAKIKMPDLNSFDLAGAVNQVKGTARWVIRSLAAAAGIRPASIHDLYVAMGEGKAGGFTVPAINVRAMAYDTIIPGYGTQATNTLRLWSARSPEELDLHAFNQGNYLAAVERKSHAENVSAHDSSLMRAVSSATLSVGA